MSTRDLFEKLTKLPEGPADIPEIPPIELIALFVCFERRLRQWKKNTLADFAGVSISTVERIERGEKVSDDALDLIAQALGYVSGHFTAPRCRIGAQESAKRLAKQFGEMEAVAVARMNTHRQVRAVAGCQAYLIHRPGVPEIYDADLTNLVDWLDLASSVLSDKIYKSPPAELKKHELYNDIVRCIREIEKHGFIVLSGVMNAPQERLPDWKVAVISVTPKLSDPGALKRKHLFVDRRTVRFNRPFDDIFAH